ncbi:MAG: hypothetical protein AAFY48_12880 [Bacteroidota bacterium]
MSVGLDNLKWSETGKRFDVSVEYEEGDGFFVSLTRISFRMYMVANGDISRMKGKERDYIKQLIEERKEWRPSKTRFSYKLQLEGIDCDVTAFIYRNSYQES